MELNLVSTTYSGKTRQSVAARIPFTYPDTEEVTAEEVDKELINE